MSSFHNYYTTNNTCCQDDDVLHDYRADGRRERPWARYKIINQYYALAYDDINPKKADRLRNCATFLKFKVGDGGMKLHEANFCRVRLCPICAWRRSLKTYSQVRACVNVIGKSHRFIFATFTIPNVNGDCLSDSISKLLIGFNRLIKYKAISKINKGYYKGLEISHNISNNTFHPHLHVLFAVTPSYFSGRTYLSQDKWLYYWRKAMQDNNIKIVDVRTVKGKPEHACAEIAKYSVKPADIIDFDDWDYTVDTISVLDSALANRRLIGYGGIFKDVHKQLHLDDSENGDLIHTDIDSMSDDDVKTIAYGWNVGYSQYRRI